MSDILPHLINDPAIEAIRETDRELAKEIADHQLAIDIARGKREVLADLQERLTKKNRTARRRIDRPATPATCPQASAPESSSETPAAASVFAPVAEGEPTEAG